MVVRVLIVDDHNVVREGLRMFLMRDPELEVVGEAADGSEAIKQARLLQPDVVVMDLLMPNLDGLAAIAAIRKELPQTEVLAFTGVLEGSSVIEAIRAGAIGYLVKDIQATELRVAIKAAASGQVSLSSKASNYLMKAVRASEPLELLTPTIASRLSIA